MKENEFDIQVRNLLQDAQESVSPKVWESVAAGLDKKSRIIPLRFWGFASGAVAVAAAVVAVVLLRPASYVSRDNSNLIQIVEAVPAVAGATDLPTTPVYRIAKRTAYVADVKVSQADIEAAEEDVAVVTPEAEEPAPVLEEKAAQPSQPAKEETPSLADMLEDQDAFNRIAWAEEKKAPSGTGFSVSVFGNLEDKRRQVSGATPIRSYLAPIKGAEEGIYNESPEVGFSLPFSAGVGVKYNFTPHWAVGIGLRYTNLSRTFVGDYVGEGFRFLQTDIDNHQHWLGIPVHVYYDIVNRGRWRVNAFVGGGAEYLVDNDYLVHGPQSDIHYHQHGERLQWSGDIGMGVEFKITPFLGVYLDPSFRYYFRTDLQPRSLRTIQPLRFDLEAGFRFSFGK